MLLLSAISLVAAGLCARAATVTYDFNVTWVTANPDGQYPRPVIGINNAWPVPPITANVDDRIIVNIQNQLSNSSTGLHFHGLYQNGTNHMDGAVGVTQCQVPPGEKFQYNFTVKQPGTYWYHAHQSGQYPDGLRGPLIIHDPDSPYKDKYDEEIVLTLSDWYHDQMADLIKSFMSVTNPTGAEPVPNSALFNDTQNVTAMVQPGKTYMFRLVNMAAFAAQYFWVEGHTMRIVEVDGIYTDEAEADMIYITAAQRLSFLLTTKDDASANFPFVGSMDQDLFDAIPDGLNPNVTGWLVYDEKAENPEPAMIDEFDPFDDIKLVPQDKEPLIDKVDHSITLDFKMDNLGDGANYAFFNDQTYKAPRVPTLYTALSTGANASDPRVYGPPTNGYLLKKGEVVEIILNNMDPGKHPFHLHGHAFQMVVRSEEEAGEFVNNETMPSTPIRRDTVLVRPNGNVVLRYRADNPARVWLFHCHIQWHFISGLIATMIEAPEDLQASGLTIPEDHLNVCRAQGFPTQGNAAGNVDDLYDLTGANEPPGPLPEGFTPRGIVALVFSIIAAFLGLAAITWYGVGDIGKKEPGLGVQKVINEARTE